MFWTLLLPGCWLWINQDTHDDRIGGDGPAGLCDEGESAEYFVDSDRDGFGGDFTKMLCAPQAGWTNIGGDCNDDNPAINPDAIDGCDGVDDDCDGEFDEDGADNTFYLDSDADGYGGSQTIQACGPPTGYTGLDGDCDDSNGDVYPFAEEVCNGFDDDCDKLIDDDDNSTQDRPLWYPDEDGDGYGTSVGATPLCEDPGAGYADNGDDCDDKVADRNPGETEVCNDGIDNNCDGVANACEVSGQMSDAEVAKATLLGESEEDRSGRRVSWAGDLNTDGNDDILVGAYQADFNGDEVGKAYVVLGPVTGEIDLADATGELRGSVDADEFGVALAGVSDVDGDGIDDVAIGSPHRDDGATNAGMVYIFQGPIFGTSGPGAADASLSGTDSSGQMGESVAALGDWNSDSISDVVAGAATADVNGANEGVAYIFIGPLTAALEAPDDAYFSLNGTVDDGDLGSDVAGDGDLDGDGLADLVVGAKSAGSSAQGAVYMVMGPASGDWDATDADGTLTGEAADDGAGYSVAIAPDLDGDGFDDVVVGAYTAQDGGINPGKAYVVKGPATGSSSVSSAEATFVGTNDNDYCGRDVSGIGDFNNDGSLDLAVTCSSADDVRSNGGTLNLFWGPISGTLSADAQITGSESSGQLGWSVSGPGDMDRDGYVDLIVGAARQDVNGSTSGSTYIFDVGI